MIVIFLIWLLNLENLISYKPRRQDSGSVMWRPTITITIISFTATTTATTNTTTTTTTTAATTDGATIMEYSLPRRQNY
jgi:hypothetical protein